MERTYFELMRIAMALRPDASHDEIRAVMADPAQVEAMVEEVRAAIRVANTAKTWSDCLTTWRASRSEHDRGIMRVWEDRLQRAISDRVG